ncbi:MAG: iron-containing alcohol dehydrogenase, partial [Clostridia bacterium]|nr:iron-containing alcohol dehydrogenase [Clostridia bacterium]
MDINTLLKGIDCSCGKKHSCDIGAVYIEKDAAKRLVKLTESYNSILLVADENTYKAAGIKVKNEIASKIYKEVVFPGNTLLIPNETAIERVTKSLESIDLIIGIGSGVIQDLCKYVSFNSGIPYFIVATAPSMDGYASSGAAMITGGMKVTYSAKVPDAIIADTEILKDAPLEMIKAG